MRKSKHCYKVVRAKEVATKPILNKSEPLKVVKIDKNSEVIMEIEPRTNTLLKNKEANSLERATMTVSEMAKYLGIGRNKAYEMVNCGKLPSIKIGKQIRIVKAALDIWLMEQSLNVSAS